MAEVYGREVAGSDETHDADVDAHLLRVSGGMANLLMTLCPCPKAARGVVNN